MPPACSPAPPRRTSSCPWGDADSVLHFSDALETVGRVDGVENPHGLAVAPGRGLLVIGSLSQTERADAAQVEKPAEMDAAAPDGTVAAALADEGAVALISDGAVAPLEIGGTLHGVQIGADAVTVAATERDVVVRVDRKTGARLERSPGAEPYHVARGGPGLLVSSSAAPLLWQLDPQTLETTARVETDGTVHQIRITGTE